MFEVVGVKRLAVVPIYDLFDLYIFSEHMGGFFA